VDSSLAGKSSVHFKMLTVRTSADKKGTAEAVPSSDPKCDLL
jgi:hypothetical protein